MFIKKTEKKRVIPVNDYEYRLILDALLSLREKLAAAGKYTDGVDETILAVSE